MTTDKKPLGKLAELRGKLSDAELEFDCTDPKSMAVAQHLQAQAVSLATLISVEAQCHQADSLSRIADQLERIALWAERVQK